MGEWTPEMHELARKMCEAATEGPWEEAVYGIDGVPITTPEEFKEALCLSIDRTVDHGDSIDRLCFVGADVDTDDPIYFACTGNGPTSRQNRAFIAHARTLLPAALDEIERRRPDPPYCAACHRWLHDELDRLRARVRDLEHKRDYEEQTKEDFASAFECANAEVVELRARVAELEEAGGAR